MCMNGGMSAARYSRDEWRAVFRRQGSSGLSVSAFCRRAGIPPSSFFAWRRKLRCELGFAEVKLATERAPEVVAPEPARATNGIELHLPGRRCVVVRAGFDRQTLLDLLAALERAGCEATEPLAALTAVRGPSVSAGFGEAGR